MHRQRNSHDVEWSAQEWNMGGVDPLKNNLKLDAWVWKSFDQAALYTTELFCIERIIFVIQHKRGCYKKLVKCETT